MSSLYGGLYGETIYADGSALSPITTGSATGSSTADAHPSRPGVGVAAGIAVVIGVPLIHIGDGDASGQSTALAQSIVNNGAGLSVGLSTVGALSISAIGVGSAAGTATVTGAIAARIGVGAASGLATVNGGSPQKYNAVTVDGTAIYDESGGTRLHSESTSDFLRGFEEVPHYFLTNPTAVDSLVAGDSIPDRYLANKTFFATAKDTGSLTDIVTDVRSRLGTAADTLSPSDVVTRAASITNHLTSDTLTPIERVTGTKRVTGFRIFPDITQPSRLLFLLPEPEFNNPEHSINRIQKYRAESGKTYTYVNRTTRVRVYSWSFVLRYQRFKELEAYLYARGQQPRSAFPQRNLNLYIAWRADLFRVKLTTNTIQATNVNGDFYRTVLDFEGVRETYGGGRKQPCTVS